MTDFCNIFISPFRELISQAPECLPSLIVFYTLLTPKEPFFGYENDDGRERIPHTPRVECSGLDSGSSGLDRPSVFPLLLVSSRVADHRAKRLGAAHFG